MREPHRIARAFRGAGGPLRLTDPLSGLLLSELLELDSEAGAALIAFEPDDRFKQGGGLIQGGIVTAMLDYALAMAAFSQALDGQSFATVSMTTHFLRPTLPGRLLARGRLDRMGGRMIFASAELFREGEEAPLATGTGVMAITRP
jgi:uncharacterized protein (TIGR00369 family)